MVYKIIHGVCETELRKLQKLNDLGEVHLTFMNPPFSQHNDFARQNGSVATERYWKWMKRICEKVFALTGSGGALYFLHNEANSEILLKTLRRTGWTFQNLIIWNKLNSASQITNHFENQYQIIAFATKGEAPRVFNHLRIDLQLSQLHKTENGIDVSDVWHDVGGLTTNFLMNSGTSSSESDVIITKEGRLFHLHQIPINLLIRIILASSLPGDLILDPFAGAGITTMVAEKLDRNSISIEYDSQNVQVIKRRILLQRRAIKIPEISDYYRHTNRLKTLLPVSGKASISSNIVNSLGTFLVKRKNP